MKTSEMVNLLSTSQVHALVADIGGFLGQHEVLWLYRAASRCRPGALVVEIGSFKGKSTILLAKGVEAAGGGKVVAIDPHLGSEEHKRDGKDIWTFDEFIQNLEKRNVRPLVEPIVDFSHRAAVSRPDIQEIDFLWIDGAHDYDSVRKDYELWRPRIREGGWIGFHDTLSGGAHRVVDEVVFRKGDLSNIGFVQSIVYGQVAAERSLLNGLARCWTRFFWRAYCRVANWGMPNWIRRLARRGETLFYGADQL